MKSYLGDSVYAAFDGHDLVLTTENGMGASNRVVLEPGVVQELAKFLDEVVFKDNNAAAKQVFDAAKGRGE